MRSVWLQRNMGALLEVQGDVYRRLALGVMAMQAAACVAAALTRVMLHGDGAFFVYALSVGEPWLLKWRDIAARATVFVTTVAPTQWIAESVGLTPLGVAQLNGFVFCFVLALQFAIACGLVWRKHPQYLLFPVAQYAFSSVMGFGYPSEILIAPGFLWIALFLILKNQAFSGSFVISFLGLLFSHELAFPAALVAAYLALRQVRLEDRYAGSRLRSAAMLFAILFGVGLLVGVWLTGGGVGSDSNAIYVIDPRRVLNNPTIWLTTASVLAALVAARRSAWMKSRVGVSVMIVAGGVLPLALQVLIPSLDFEQGRYDSARSIVAGMMFVLALCFAAVLHHRSDDAPAPAKQWADRVPLVLAVALAVTAGSGVAFLRDWTTALHGLERVMFSSSTAEGTRFITYSQARALMRPDEARANDRIDFHWALPFRCVVLADGGLPGRIVYAEADYRWYCAKAELISPERAIFPHQVLEDLHHFSCTHRPPPPLNTISRRVGAFIKRLLGGKNASDER